MSTPTKCIRKFAANRALQEAIDTNKKIDVFLISSCLYDLDEMRKFVYHYRFIVNNVVFVTGLHDAQGKVFDKDDMENVLWFVNHEHTTALKLTGKI